MNDVMEKQKHPITVHGDVHLAGMGGGLDAGESNGVHAIATHLQY
jgi:hypothetical protein